MASLDIVLYHHGLHVLHLGHASGVAPTTHGTKAVYCLHFNLVSPWSQNLRHFDQSLFTKNGRIQKRLNSTIYHSKYCIFCKWTFLIGPFCMEKSSFVMTLCNNIYVFVFWPVLPSIVGIHATVLVEASRICWGWRDLNSHHRVVCGDKVQVENMPAQPTIHVLFLSSIIWNDSWKKCHTETT